MDPSVGSIKGPVAVEAGRNRNRPRKFQWFEPDREGRTPAAKPGSLAYNSELPCKLLSLFAGFI